MSSTGTKQTDEKPVSVDGIVRQNIAAERVVNFLLKNGWRLDYVEDKHELILGYSHDGGCVGVDLNFANKQIVLISDMGDFCQLPLNYYALIGALIEFHQIGFNYKRISA